MFNQSCDTHLNLFFFFLVFFGIPHSDYLSTFKILHFTHWEVWHGAPSQISEKPLFHNTKLT